MEQRLLQLQPGTGVAKIEKASDAMVSITYSYVYNGEQRENIVRPYCISPDGKQIIARFNPTTPSTVLEIVNNQIQVVEASRIPVVAPVTPEQIQTAISEGQILSSTKLISAESQLGHDESMQVYAADDHLEILRRGERTPVIVYLSADGKKLYAQLNPLTESREFGIVNGVIVDLQQDKKDQIETLTPSDLVAGEGVTKIEILGNGEFRVEYQRRSDD
ncbi:MAG: hypothetical protein H6765_06270 [Candidatus Peribacteria bacterium]|nr:MAG: hypothetical protein H6765_06270 [Candidatus Peribacteria bacterium]